jgi:hypothetical protein
MTTVGELVTQTTAVYLMGTYRPLWARLAQDLGIDHTDVTLTTGVPNLGNGSLLAIDDELLLVRDVSADRRTATVDRAVHGSLIQFHAQSALVEINPRYPRYLIRQELARTVESWPDRLFWTDAITVRADTEAVPIDHLAVTGTASTGQVIGVVRVIRDRRRLHRYRVEPDLRYEGSLDLYLEGEWGVMGEVRVLRARRFDVTEFDDSVEIEDECHIPPDLHQAMRLGAAARLVTGKETIRLGFDSQGDSRRADEVREQSNSRFGVQLRALADVELDNAAMRLAERFGVREIWAF